MNILIWLLKGLITVYRYTLSPLLGKNCRFLPTCSEYAYDAIDRFGSFKGGLLALRRMGRCHPWGGSGYDPVPDIKKSGKCQKEKCNCRADDIGPLKK
ncbi:Membrane protein insertion efficiency factor YidD [hydrothermal vent metagenome]|uniref:Membrane protein insertion efficiency factor YidD n=1 Tax=hydrothermal vent metagenome TaxID=652676 RepID=A0A3B1ATB8_9ZZZZ